MIIIIVIIVFINLLIYYYYYSKESKMLSQYNISLRIEIIESFKTFQNAFNEILNSFCEKVIQTTKNETVIHFIYLFIVFILCYFYITLN